MAMYMPQIARKKIVCTRYNPDTFRVISVEAEENHPIQWPPVLGQRELPTNPVLTDPNWNAVQGKPQVLPHPVDDYRVNRPHPAGCGFLRHNVTLLNEPICTVYTDATNAEQDRWWPSRTSSKTPKTPFHTKDTIYRQDFHLDKEKSSISSGLSRHTSNPNKDPALGVVPVNFLRSLDGKQQLLKEKISFDHLYNCRMDSNYPIRAKRHGSFVWEHIRPEKAIEIINDHVKLTGEGAKLSTEMQHTASQEGSPKVSLLVRSPTFVDHMRSEKVPQSPASCLTSLNMPMDRMSHEGSPKGLSPAMSPPFEDKICAKKLPQSPARSLTSEEVKQNSRQASGINSPLKSSIAHYPVISSIQDAIEGLPCGKAETNKPKVISPRISVAPQSRNRATPIRMPISPPVKPDRSAVPTSVAANTKAVGFQMNNNTAQVGVPRSTNRSNGPLSDDYTFNIANEMILAVEKHPGSVGVKPGEGKHPTSSFARPGEPLPFTLSVKPANIVKGLSDSGHKITKEANGMVEAKSYTRGYDEQSSPTTVDIPKVQDLPGSCDKKCLVP